MIVTIPAGNISVEGELIIPKNAKGLVIFAHGSGSSRHSPRNMLVAERLQKVGMATLLVDLLSQQEDSDYRNRFDISLLTERLAAITTWAKQNETTSGLAVGYFGASTGAAAAMLAAQNSDAIKAIVSRGGRVDLGSEATKFIQAPTLLIVGGEDSGVLEANQEVLEQLNCVKQLEIVAGATHLFEEPGALEKVAELAAKWFKEYLT